MQFVEAIFIQIYTNLLLYGSHIGSAIPNF